MSWYNSVPRPILLFSRSEFGGEKNEIQAFSFSISSNDLYNLLIIWLCLVIINKVSTHTINNWSRPKPRGGRVQSLFFFIISLFAYKVSDVSFQSRIDLGLRVTSD